MQKLSAKTRESVIWCKTGFTLFKLCMVPNKLHLKHLLGGWCETCSAIKVSWSRLHQGIGPSGTGWGSFSSVGMSQWHWKISPRIGLYGFLATALLRPAWYALRYQRHTWTIRSRGSARSAILYSGQVTLLCYTCSNKAISTGILLQKQIRMSKIIGVHLQQWSTLQDESGQHNLRQVHSDLYLW